MKRRTRQFCFGSSPSIQRSQAQNVDLFLWKYPSADNNAFKITPLWQYPFTSLLLINTPLNWKHVAMQKFIVTLEVICIWVSESTRELEPTDTQVMSVILFPKWQKEKKEKKKKLWYFCRKHALHPKQHMCQSVKPGSCYCSFQSGIFALKPQPFLLHSPIFSLYLISLLIWVQ